MTYPPYGDRYRTVTTPVPLQVRWTEPAAPPPPGPHRRWVWPSLFALSALAVCALLAVLLLQGTATAAPPASGSPSKVERVVPDTGWEDVDLVGDWRATGDGARYRVRDGVCYLQLHVALDPMVWGPNTPMAQLPASARPAWHMGFVAVRSGLPFGEVKVFSDGRVFVVAPSTAPGGDVTVSAAFPVGR